jgi:hypothetical protein
MAMESLGEHFVNHAQRLEQGLDSRMQRFTGYPVTFTPLVQKCDAHPGETRRNRCRTPGRPRTQHEDVGGMHRVFLSSILG